MNEQLNHWLNTNLPLVTQHTILSVHLDELLDHPIATSDYLPLGLDLFGQSIKYIQSLPFSAKPMLVIPLMAYSNQMKRLLPSTQSELEAHLTPEPPSLYLLNETPVEYFGVCEEYRSPLPFDLITRTEVYVYYREYRYEMDIRHDWEFMRAIYVNYWPPCEVMAGDNL